MAQRLHRCRKGDSLESIAFAELRSTIAVIQVYHRDSMYNSHAHDATPIPLYERNRRITSTVVILALLCTLIAVARLRFIRDLPDWDVATYALIGHELSHGERLYADIWDMKPPGIFASFALAEWITRGSHEWSAYLVSVVASIVTTIAIYFAGKALSGRAAGLWASGAVDVRFACNRRSMRTCRTPRRRSTLFSRSQSQPR